ncbi:hypothetical protein HK405_014996, partial [Cladochytrium tenue]
PDALPHVDAPHAPPGSRVFSLADLTAFDGADSAKPLYIAVAGVVYDVSGSRALYAPGTKYGIFAGRDASKALAISSLKEEDCVPVDDPASLTPEQAKTLEKWVGFFSSKYDVVGTVAK